MRFAALSVALVCGVSACSSSSPAKSEAPDDIVPVGSGDGGEPVSRDAAAPEDSSVAVGVVDGGPSLGTVPVPVVDVPDIAAVDVGGTGTEVTPAEPNGPLYDRLGSLGERHFAVSSDGLSFLTFGEGEPISPVVPNVVTAAAEGNLIAALAKSGTALSLQRYTEHGVASGAPATVAPSADWQAVGVDATSTLVVWSHDAALSGALMARGTATMRPLDLGATAAAGGTYAIQVVPSGAGFVVTWTRNRLDKRTETLWLRVGDDGSISSPTTVLLSTAGHALVGASALPTGTALLVNEGLPVVDSVVLRVDTDGKVTAITRLLGTSTAFGLAANAAELGVVAARQGHAVLRTLGADGAALGPFYVLDDAPVGGTFIPQSAVVTDGAGYAHLTHVKNGAAVFRRSDRTGLGL